MSEDRRTYDPAFKRNAVQLSYERKNMRELADELIWIDDWNKMFE